MKEKIKIAYPFLIYCLVQFVFYFNNLFKIENYQSLLEIIGMSLFAGFFEELIFRHWLQDSISKKLESKHKSVYAIFIVAFLFGILHMTNLVYNENNVSDVIIQSLSAMGGGVILGSIYYKTNSYLLVAALHSIYDITSLLGSRYCTICSLNINLEIMIQFAFNVLISIFILNNYYLFDRKVNDKNKSKKIQLLYNVLYIILLVSILLLMRNK